jgi:hypothetical protein
VWSGKVKGIYLFGEVNQEGLKEMLSVLLIKVARRNVLFYRRDEITSTATSFRWQYRR